MLEISNLSKQFGATAALKEVSISIPKGQMVGVIGRSGAGKSTLLRLVNRLERATSGSIRFKGRDVTMLRGRELNTWRRTCAMIFQQFNLIDRMDVITNVLVGRLNHSALLPTLVKAFSAADRARAIEALHDLDMAEYALQRAETLSGGQQQRVAIARALVQEPDIILADEPVASLDPQNSRAVMQSLRRINTHSGITVICNLHALDLAEEFCDRIIGLSRGQVVFDEASGKLDKSTIATVYEARSADREVIRVPEMQIA